MSDTEKKPAPSTAGRIQSPSLATLLHRERRALSQIGQGVSLSDVLEELLKALEAEAPGDMLTSVLFLSDDGSRLLNGAAPSLPAPYNEAIHGIAIGEGVGSCGTAAHRGTAVYVSDISRDPLWADFRELALSHGLRACWSTPIVGTDSDRVLGTFAVYYREPCTPTEGDLDAIATITQTTALAIERHLADEAQKRRETLFRFLDQLGKAITEANGADALLKITTRMTGHHLGGSICAYADMDEDEDGFTIRGDWSAEGSPSIVGRYRLMDFGALAVANLKAGVPLVINNNLTEIAAHEAATFQAIGISATICMPLIRAGRLAALMAIHDRNPRTWTANELMVMREVTERSWAHVQRVGIEDDLRRLNATLEEQVQERTSRLLEAEEALRQSQKMEAVGQLTGGIAHDFNNLLQIVNGNLEILQRHLPADQTRLRRAADNALTGAKRAASLTQRLLAFSRRQPLEPRALDLRQHVGGMHELLERTLGETVELQTVYGGGLWRVEADPAQLENALLNLALNARDAMPEGGKLTIETGNVHLDQTYAGANVEVRAGQYAMISVSDTGQGMDAASIARAFEPFYTTKEVGRGTGLGLSMVYGFIKQSGGHVKIYSEVGHGTTVKIYLPRLIGEAQTELETKETFTPEGSAHEKILVVEDDPDVRAYSVEALRELGYRVLEARDGPSALTIMAQHLNDLTLLFTDVVLPGGMTGAQLAVAAQKLKPGLKVLYTTGYARNAIVHHGRLDPGVALLGKPFNLSDLASRVRDLLDEAPEQAT